MASKLQYENIITEDIENGILESISNIFGFSVSIANKPDLKVTKRYNQPKLCEYICSNEKCKKVCDLTSENLCNKAKQTGEVVTGYCPFGLIKTVIPLKVINEIIGAIFCCGQYYQKKPTKAKIKEIVKKYNLDEKIYQQYSDEVGIVDENVLKIAREEIRKNFNNLSKILYSNYILKELAKREMFLKEITRIVLKKNDKDEIISEIVERLAREFEIQRVAIIELKENESYVKDDYINGRNIRLEALSKQEYTYLFKRLKIRAEENNGIFVLSSSSVDVSDAPAPLKKYWNASQLKTMTTFLVRSEDVERMIIFCSYDEEKNWSIDEFAFLSAVSEQIATVLKLSYLYELSKKSITEE